MMLGVGNNSTVKSIAGCLKTAREIYHLSE